MFDYAVSLLYRPKNLQRLIDGTDNGPAAANLPYYQDTTIVTSTDNLKEAMNKYELFKFPND